MQCLKGGCSSPVACGGFGYCRERNFANRHETFMPDNEHGVAEGYYDRRGIVALLRQHRGNPAAVQFIADMME